MAHAPGATGRRWQSVPWVLVGLFLLGVWMPARGGAAEEPIEPVNLWPIYDQRLDRVEGAETHSSLGPVFTSSQSTDGNVEEFGIRPLFFRREDRAAKSLEWEFLYPVMTYRRTEADWEWQFLKLFDMRGEGSPQAEREERSVFFPFYFQGSSTTGQKSLGILPFYGRTHDMLFWEEFDWVMFPLYARSVRLGVETHYFPYPFLSVTSSVNPDDQVSGFRFVPLFGRETKHGEGAYEKTFLLWPLFLYERTGLDESEPNSGRARRSPGEETLAIIPFYVKRRAPTVDSTTVLWPFFSYVQDREQKYEQVTAPWPLVKFAWGEGRQTFNILPFYGDDQKVLHNEFLFKELRFHDRTILYPLYIRNEEYDRTSTRIRDRILWYLYSDYREEGADGSTRRIDSWPFFWYDRDREGAVHFQTLALLEPLIPPRINEYMLRNYYPLWALYTYDRNAAGEYAHSFLWNFVRVEQTQTGHSIEVLGPLLALRQSGDRSTVSLFGGLIQLEHDGMLRSLRFFDTPLLTWAEDPQTVATTTGELGGVR